MSFEDESHSMSNISGLQGSGESSLWKAVFLNLGEVRADSPDLEKVGTSFQEAIWTVDQLVQMLLFSVLLVHRAPF